MADVTIDLSGHNAVVTGGAAGMGLAIAQRLASAGANICIWDLNQGAIDQAAKEISTNAIGVDVLKHDATDCRQHLPRFQRLVAQPAWPKRAGEVSLVSLMRTSRPRLGRLLEERKKEHGSGLQKALGPP